jgi:hypothetical protein
MARSAKRTATSARPRTTPAEGPSPSVLGISPSAAPSAEISGGKSLVFPVYRILTENDYWCGSGKAEVLRLLGRTPSINRANVLRFFWSQGVGRLAQVTQIMGHFELYHILRKINEMRWTSRKSTPSWSTEKIYSVAAAAFVAYWKEYHRDELQDNRVTSARRIVAGRRYGPTPDGDVSAKHDPTAGPRRRSLQQPGTAEASS